MQFYYQAYGIPIISQIELPALLSTSENTLIEPVRIEKGIVPSVFKHPPSVQKPLSAYNEQEFMFKLPNIVSVYITEGKHIIVEPHCEDWTTILAFLYSTGLAAILYQRNQLPFHVSGILVNTDEVILFTAPSQTGKSTTAMKLKEKGYPTFTDDTALIWVENGICYAQASYPITRLWQDALLEQKVYAEADKQILHSEIDKYAFDFHNAFDSRRKKVKSFVFLDVSGDDIHIEPLKSAKILQLLSKSVFRNQWIVGTKKQLLQYKLLTEISQAVSFFVATRPIYKKTFEAFAIAIEHHIIHGQ